MIQRAVEEGGEQVVQLGGGLGLQALLCVHLRLQRVQLGHRLALEKGGAGTQIEILISRFGLSDSSDLGRFDQRPACVEPAIGQP